MPQLVWDQAATSSSHEAGVDRGVFYPRSGPGIVWNGLTSVQESPSGSDEDTRYIDGVKTRTRRKGSEFAGRIEAFTYPEELYEDALLRRRQQGFGFSYRVMTGDSYKVHLVYNVLLGPENHDYQYDENSTFSWDFTTKPVHIPGLRPSAHLVIDSAIAYPQTMQAFEDLIYGSNAAESRFPTPVEVLNIFEENAIVRVYDHGDGSWTVTGPDDVLIVNPDGSFELTWPSAVWVDQEQYTIQSF